MAVKFENEDTEAMPTRGPHRKILSSGTPEKPKLQGRPERPERPKRNLEKFKEISYKVGIKNERRKRKYKKKQIEQIGWYYTEASDPKIRDLIDEITILEDTQKNTAFFGYIFNTAFMQSPEQGFNIDNYLLVKEHISPIIFKRGIPIFMNDAVKSLQIYETY